MLKRITRIGIPALVLVLSVGIAGYLKETRPSVMPKPPEERVWTVAAVTVQVVSIQPEMKLFGEIVSGRTVELRPQVSGRIVQASANLVEGGVVRADEIIVHIDPFDYEADVRQREAELAEAHGRLKELEAQLAGAKALLAEDVEQVTIRRRDAERRTQLRGSGAGTVKSADDARLALSETEQRRIDRSKEATRLEAVIDQQRAAIDRIDVALARAKRNLSETRVVAPYSGFLHSVETAQGKWVNVGDRLARLVDAGRLEARFHISRTQFRRLMAGGGYQARPARIVWRGRADATPYAAAIDRVGGEVDAATGGVSLYAKIDTGGLETVLRPGAFVEVYIADRMFDRVVRLPATSVHDDGVVYVAKHGRLEAKYVEVVTRVGGDVIVSGALADGDRVVTTRLPELAPGLKVRVQ